MPRGRPLNPDRTRVKQNVQFNKSRTQARFRNEIWELDFEQWLEAWGDNYQYRGKSSDSKCMVRKDWTGIWCVNNVQIVGRCEFIKMQKEYKQ